MDTKLILLEKEILGLKTQLSNTIQEKEEFRQQGADVILPLSVYYRKLKRIISESQEFEGNDDIKELFDNISSVIRKGQDLFYKFPD